MSTKTINFGEEIAKASLLIGGIKLSPKEPFTWSSGTKNPIYNDNRMLLASHEHRALTTDGFVDLLERNKIDIASIDYICGTSMSGIAPAASLAMQLMKDLIFFHENILYVYSFNWEAQRLSNIICPFKSYQPLLANAPFGIPQGILYANKRQSSFGYIRPEKKRHGLQKRIEGFHPKEGEKFDLYIERYEWDDDKKILDLLDEEKVHYQNAYITGIESERAKHIDFLKNKKVIIIEDLVSTGGSYMKEVQACQTHGADVIGVASIFNYELEHAKEKIKASGIPLYSLLNYDTLLEVGVKEGHINDTEVAMLEDWRPDPENWGEKHGFPPEKK